jgi:hypothetical protein
MSDGLYKLDLGPDVFALTSLIVFRRGIYPESSATPPTFRKGVVRAVHTASAAPWLIPTKITLSGAIPNSISVSMSASTDLAADAMPATSSVRSAISKEYTSNLPM